jgi:hypothetical protein
MIDPFLNTDPRFEPHELKDDADLAQPDLTPCTIKDFLRTSRRVQRLLDEISPPIRPKPSSGDGRVLPHIYGFPG